MTVSDFASAILAGFDLANERQVKRGLAANWKLVKLSSGNNDEVHVTMRHLESGRLFKFVVSAE